RNAPWSPEFLRAPRSGRKCNDTTPRARFHSCSVRPARSIFSNARNRGLGPLAVTVLPTPFARRATLPLAPPCNRQCPFSSLATGQGDAFLMARKPSLLLYRAQNPESENPIASVPCVAGSSPSRATLPSMASPYSQVIRPFREKSCHPSEAPTYP